MDFYLPSGEQYIRKAFTFSLSSPFLDRSGLPVPKIWDIFKEAVQFALNMITMGSRSENENNSSRINFKNVLNEVLG